MKRKKEREGVEGKAERKGMSAALRFVGRGLKRPYGPFIETVNPDRVFRKHSPARRGRGRPVKKLIDDTSQSRTNSQRRGEKSKVFSGDGKKGKLQQRSRVKFDKGR